MDTKDFAENFKDKIPGNPTDKPDASKDTSKPGREEEVIDQSTETGLQKDHQQKTSSRAFNEGLADNSNTENPS